MTWRFIYIRLGICHRYGTHPRFESYIYNPYVLLSYLILQRRYMSTCQKVVGKQKCNHLSTPCVGIFDRTFNSNIEWSTFFIFILLMCTLCCNFWNITVMLNCPYLVNHCKRSYLLDFINIKSVRFDLAFNSCEDSQNGTLRLQFLFFVVSASYRCNDSTPFERILYFGFYFFHRL